MLSRAAGVKAPGEIANGASAAVRTEGTSFLKFRRDRWLAGPDGFFANWETQRRLLDDYFTGVRALFPGQQYVILDVKYAHVHNFNGYWWDPSTPPLLIDYARTNRIKIVHLVRAKVYGTVISTLYAHRSGVWRAKETAQLRPTRIEVKKDELMRRAREIAETVALFDRWFAQCDCLRLTYERLVADMGGTLAAVKAFLEISSDIPAKPGYIKTTPPYPEAVTNFSEIADLVDLEIGDPALLRASTR
jgi:hypothetical protein